ncbi:MAG: PorT family protein [Cytophagaceae bacterium]|nr:PorT family protein [Cytophagaceae bacterium]
MKTSVRILVALLVLTPTFALAQGKFLSFGLKVGANFSQLNTLKFQTPRLTTSGVPFAPGGQIVYDFFRNNSSSTTGIVGGVFVRIGRKFYVQPELLLSAKGGSFDIIQTGLATQKIDVKLTTLDLPLLLGIRLGPLRLNAGPMASLTVSQNENLKEALDRYTNQPVNETLKKAVFGYQAGIGATLLGVNLDLRYEGNLSDLSAVGINTSGDERFTTKVTLFQLTVGYGF